MSDLLGLAMRKLSECDGDYLFGDGSSEYGVRFEQFEASATKEMREWLDQKGIELSQEADPSLISIKSWQFGFTGSQDESQAITAARDGLYLTLQSYLSGYMSSQKWHSVFAAFDAPRGWLELGDQAESEARTIEANACYAAACWLDPVLEESVAARKAERSPELPARLLQQPDPSYPGRPFRKRHWLAWDMSNYGHLDQPTLVRWECDRNFSIRTRIYRSLGHGRHPASIQVLREGTFDPHPFARGQAVRSLARCKDPFAEPRLRSLAAEDEDAEVRRAAAKGLQRLFAYWQHYGEWGAICRSERKAFEVARELAEQLPAFAHELLVYSVSSDSVDEADRRELIDRVEPHALLYKDPEDRSDGLSPRDYPFWFPEAQSVEAGGEPLLSESEARARILEGGPGAHEARRTMRVRGLGSLDERRASWPG